MITGSTEAQGLVAESEGGMSRGISGGSWVYRVGPWPEEAWMDGEVQQSRAPFACQVSRCI